MIDESPYQTPRLMLRDLCAGDEDAVAALLGDMRVVKNMLFSLHTPAEAAQFTARASRMRQADPLVNFGLAIVDRAGGAPIGLAGLVLNARLASGEAWYLLAPAAWGRGLATEALEALARIGFTELKLHRLWATCLPENPASSRVLEKAGFRLEGRHVKNLPIHGEWRDSWSHALLAEEWRARSRS